MIASTKKFIQLYKILSSKLLGIDDISFLIIEYAQKNLWDYKVHNDRGCNENADSCGSWDEYLKLISNRALGLDPVTFEWECDSDIFSEDKVPYTEDVLFLDFLANYSVWVKVNKSDQLRIMKYLENKMNFSSQLDML